MRFIETWPSLLVAVREEGVDGTELKGLEEGFERRLQRSDPFVVLGVTELRAPPLDVLARQQMAEWGNRPRIQHLFKQSCAGWVSVVAQEEERRALTALLWLWRPAVPHDAVETVARGIEVCITRLRERKVQLPTSPDALRREVHRGLSKLPLAGLKDGVGPPAARRSGAHRIGVLQKVTKAGGSYVLGWLRPGVLWVSFHGHLSEELAQLYAQRLERVLRDRVDVSYFADASGIDSTDLAGRNSVLRTLVDHRSCFSSIQILNWSGGVSSTGQALLAGPGGAGEADPRRRTVRTAPRHSRPRSAPARHCLYGGGPTSSFAGSKGGLNASLWRDREPSR